MPTTAFSAPAEITDTITARAQRSGRKKSAQIQQDLGLFWSLLDGALSDALDALTEDQANTILTLGPELRPIDPVGFMAATRATDELVALAGRVNPGLGETLDEMPQHLVLALRDWVEQHTEDGKC
jgi:hypothetical protein